MLETIERFVQVKDSVERDRHAFGWFNVEVMVNFSIEEGSLDVNLVDWDTRVIGYR